VVALQRSHDQAASALQVLFSGRATPDGVVK
jgi:hypothetical protein